MKHFFLLLYLLSYVCASAQNLVSIPSFGEDVLTLTAKGNDLYVVTKANGIIILNTESGDVRKLNASNWPLESTSITKAQIFSPDTFLVSAGFQQWIYLNGYWKLLRDRYASAVMSEDYRVFGKDDSILEYIGDSWRTYAGEIAVTHWANDYHNDLENRVYGKLRKRATSEYGIFKYENGEWVNLPLPNDSGMSYSSVNPLYFDKENNLYVSVYHSSAIPIGRYYVYNGVTWSAFAINSPSTGNILGVTSDSTNVHFVLLEKNGTKNIIWNDENGIENYYYLDSFGLDAPATAMVGLQNDKLAISTSLGSIYVGTLLEGFTQLYIGNECGSLNDWYNNVGKFNDDFITVTSKYQLARIDSALATCSLVNDSAIINLYNDNLDNVWVLNSDFIFHRFGTGEQKDVTGLYNAHLYFIGSSVIWNYGNEDGNYEHLYVYENGVNSHVVEFYTEIDKSIVDRFDNIWLDHKDGYSSEVYRLTKSAQLDLVARRNGTMVDLAQTYETYFTRDDSGYVWVRCKDTLTRYRNSLTEDTLKICLPHSAMDVILHVKVFNESEIVTISYDNVFYYHNDSLYVAPRKFRYSNDVKIFSYHDNRVVFFTNSDGIQLYNFNYPDYLNGNQLSGVLYLDENNNQTKELFERGAPYQSVTINNDLFATNNIGLYQAAVQDGAYVIKPSAIPYFVAHPDSYSVTASASRFDTLHFAYSAPTPVNDIEVHITPMPFPLGYLGNLYTSVKNNGTAPVNAILTIEYDTALGITHATPQTASQQPGLATIQYNNLYPNEIVNGEIHFQMPILFPDGDSSLRFVATITPLAGDTTPANNVDSITEYPVSSYDPNDKLVSPAGLGIYNTIDTNQELTYTIRFQNTGTYKAINIMLADTLSSKLDAATFHYIGSSATCTYAIKNHVLTVNFKNINLPHADENEPGSHGYFKFRIKPVDAIAYGDSITNKAYIYFDFNEAIITNETEVTFGPVVYANNPNFNPSETITVFPQPFTNTLNFHVNNAVSLPATAQVYDVSGKVVAEKAINAATESIQTGNLAVGTYTLRIVDSQKQRFSTNCIKVK